MESDFISYENIRISTYDLKYIKDLSIENEINNYGSLKFTGVIDESVKDKYAYSTHNMTPIKVCFQKEDKLETLFKGIVTKVKINSINNVYTIYVEAKSLAYSMDIYKKKRAFQNINMSVHQLIRKIISNYSNAKCDINIPDNPIGQFVLQYDETDLEFLKRFISKYNSVFIDSIHSENMNIGIGASGIEVNPKSDLINYTVRKDINEYNIIKSSGVQGIDLNNFITYKVKMLEVLRVGEKFQYKGQTLYVKKAKYQIVNSKLEMTYELRKKNGLIKQKLYNKRIIGISIKGSILQVQRDRVRAKLQIENGSSENYWFPYSTVAASPDGSGWYCMPEIGEEVRIYCPTKDEKDVIAISAIGSHKADVPSKNDRMSNPDTKSLQTDSGQEVKFTPSGIVIECDGGQAKMELNKDGNINVKGQKNINLACGNKLSLRAENEFNIKGKQKIDILCESGSNLVMDEDITFTGTRVHNNG